MFQKQHSYGGPEVGERGSRVLGAKSQPMWPEHTEKGVTAEVKSGADRSPGDAGPRRTLRGLHL